MLPRQFLATLALALPLVAARSNSDNLGCYSTVAGLSSIEHYTFQSHGYCIEKCAKSGDKYAALMGGNLCGCSKEAPAASAKVADNECNRTCDGWPGDQCTFSASHYPIVPISCYR